MPKRYEISDEQEAELTHARKRNTEKHREKRLEVLLLHAEGKSRAAIAAKTGFCKPYISNLVSRYCHHGIGVIMDNNYRGNNRNMSFEEEAALLEPFKKAAEAGQLVEISEIKAAYEKALGRSIDSSHGHVYRVLHRHGWRKVMPRSKHPKKASEEAIEASKKLTPT